MYNDLPLIRRSIRRSTRRSNRQEAGAPWRRRLPPPDSVGEGVFADTVDRDMRYTAILVFTLLTFPVGAHEIVLGSGDTSTWRADHAESTVLFVEGTGGSIDLAVPSVDRFDGATDLSVDLSPAFAAVGGLYSVVAQPTEAAAFGEGTSPLRIAPLPGALFSPGSHWGAVTVAFSLRTPRPAPGTTILQWEGTILIDGALLPQRFVVAIENARIRFEASNFLFDGATPIPSVVVAGRRPLLPGRAQDHRFVLDPTTGTIEYYVDDILEAVQPIGRFAAGAIVGDRSFEPMEIGEGLVGEIVDMRISQGATRPTIEVGRPHHGRFVSAAIDLGSNGARVTGIDFSSRDGASIDADYLGYYRVLPPIPQQSRPDWIPFTPGRTLPGEEGRFVQVRLDLYGEDAEVSELRVSYTEDTPPPAPPTLRAIPGDGTVTLEWATVPVDDVVGYLVHYGYDEDTYWGTGALQGRSPIDVGMTARATVDGLTNGVRYFFRVSTYDASNRASPGSYSYEVSARPLPEVP